MLHRKKTKKHFTHQNIGRPSHFMSDDLFLLLQLARRLLAWRAVECTAVLFLGQRQWHKLHKDIKALFFLPPSPIGFMHFDKREIGTWE